jgi:hypothetical protein
VRRRISLTLVVTLALAAAVTVGWFSDYYGSDFGMFAAAGRTLASTRWLHTYHDSFVQAGPFELLICAFAKMLGGGGRDAAIVLDVAGMLALLAVAYTTVARRARELLLVATAALALFVVRDLGADAHPAEVGIALLWFLAARDARAGRVWRAGLLVGVSAGFETWGVLGVTVLLLATRIRDSAVAAGGAALVAAAIYAPFLAGGDFHMFELHWKTAHGLAGTVFGLGHAFTWPMRLAEAAIVVAAGGTLARAVRRSPTAVWLVPAATSLVRLLLDPIRYGYYWDTALTLFAIGLAPWLVAPRALAGALEAWLAQRLGRATLAGR